MKKIIFLVFIIFILINIKLLYSDDSHCTDAKCLSSQFPYLLCGTDGKPHWKCSSDPNNEPGFTPIKEACNCNPSDCYKSDSYIVETDDVGDPCNNILYDGFNNPLFNINEVPQNIKDAFNAWNNLCSNKINTNQNCCPIIKWTEEPNDFNDNGGNSKTTYGLTNIEFDSPCHIDCSKLIIYLNETYDFTGASDDDPCDYNQRFYVNQGNECGGWASLKAVVEHELGHYFGFGDEYKSDDYGNTCKHDGSIMTGTNTDPNRGLSDDDICMYVKLYCCSNTQTDVKENLNNEKINFNLFPNPVSDYLSIDTKDIYYNQLINIYNIYGQKILECSYSDKIDVSNLLPGAYYFRLADKTIKFIKQ